MAKIDYNFSNGLRYYPIIHENEGDEHSQVLSLEYISIPTSIYEKITEDMSLMSYGFDVEDGEKGNFNKVLKLLEADSDFSYDSRDLQMKSFKDFKNLIKFVGYSLSVALFLISILNFITTETIKNMVHFSVLEAIGMTKKKIKSYLVKKNLISSISSLVFFIIVMLLVNPVIRKDFIEQTKWTSCKSAVFLLMIVNSANILPGILFTWKFFCKLHLK